MTYAKTMNVKSLSNFAPVPVFLVVTLITVELVR